MNKSSAKTYNSRYEKIRSIGQGSYGKIKLAKDLETDSFVAIKKLYNQNEVSIDTTREEKILKELLHPNIVQLLETFEKSKNRYLVMPYAGRDLGILIDLKDYSLQARDVKWIFSKLAAGVGYLHGLGIMHRVIYF